MVRIGLKLGPEAAAWVTGVEKLLARGGFRAILVCLPCVGSNKL